MPRTLSDIFDDIAKEALASGDQPILDLVEEACDLIGGWDPPTSALSGGGGNG